MNPYEKLGSDFFWKLAVAKKEINEIQHLWNPKFNIRKVDKIITFGSCFAQHIGRALKNREYNWLVNERPPEGLSKENAKIFNYNIFSSRTGNIYTTSLLKQWTDWALNESCPPEEFWEKEGRYYDPFRPRIEPNGFDSIEEMILSRTETINAFRDGIVSANYFVFTLGLTESWFNIKGYEYPMCPGTVAGEFDPIKHKFKNQQFSYILKNLVAAMEMMLAINKQLKFLLTVSPVPLTATCSGNHVLVATCESKSTLRAIAGQLSANRCYVDYFPSYEIITSPIFKGQFYSDNDRDVRKEGVNFVMNMFFNCLNNKFSSGNKAMVEKTTVDLYSDNNQDDVVCEEELLSAFFMGN